MLWRIPSAVGGAGGLISLLLPYALVSGGVLGQDIREKPYTLFELARLLENTGNDPQMVYLLVVLVVVGSTMAIVSAFAQSTIALGGGLVQATAAAAFVYGATTEGSTTFLYGLGQLDMSLETGLFVLVGASVVSLAALPVKLVTDVVRSDRVEVAST